MRAVSRETIQQLDYLIAMMAADSASHQNKKYVDVAR